MLLCLVNLNLSMMLDTMASSTETAEVTAAKNTITKNKVPMTFPAKPIARNTFGRDTNISPGPADIPSVPMNVNTAGTINMPASNATSVSKISIWLMDFIRFVSFFA